jgi:hypothetical protein
MAMSQKEELSFLNSEMMSAQRVRRMRKRMSCGSDFQDMLVVTRRGKGAKFEHALSGKCFDCTQVEQAPKKLK